MHNLSSRRTEKFFAAVPKGLIRFLPLSPLWDFTQHIHSTSSSSAENQQLYNDFLNADGVWQWRYAREQNLGVKLHDALSRPLNWLYETHSVVFLSSWLAKIRWTKYLNPARCILAAWDIDQTDNIWQPYNSDAFHRTANTEKNSEGRQAQCTKSWDPKKELGNLKSL